MAFVASPSGRLVERHDWASYFVASPLAEAKTAFDNGKLLEAKKRLQAVEQSVAVRFLLGLTLMKLQDHPASAATFEALAPQYPAMRDWCLLHAGWSYEAARNWDKAEAVYQQLTEQSPLAFDAVIGLSHVYKRTRRFELARERLAPYLEQAITTSGRQVAAEAWWALADVDALAGAVKLQQKSLLKLYAQFPASPLASQVESKIPNPYALLSVEQKVSRAEGLIDIHQNAAGLEQLNRLKPELKPSDPLNCRVLFGMGRAQRKLRQHAAAKVTLSALLKTCQSSELAPKALSLLGYSQSLTSAREAKQTYLKLANLYPGSALADDALFSAGESAQRSDQSDEAAALFVRLVNEYPNSEFAGEALFHLFGLYARNEQSEVALEFLDEAMQRYAFADDSYEVERASYWRARFEQKRGEKAEAAQGFERLARAHPVSYYGLLAREQLLALEPQKAAALAEQLESPGDGRDLFPLSLGQLVNDKQFATAVELARLGLTDQMLSVLNSFDRSKLTEPSLKAMAALLSTAGEFRLGHQLARLWMKRSVSGAIDADSDATFRIAYPLAYRDLIVEHSQSAAQLDPDLLQALMREESALDAKVLSWAGAYGLCQLMPRTAAGVAASLKIRRPTGAQLFDPSLNIRLGAKYLSTLVKRFGGVKPFAIASYNAGEAAVDRWRRERPTTELDQWIEDIPLQETRGYVKRVLRSYNTYKLLYAKQLAKTVEVIEKPGAIAKPK